MYARAEYARPWKLLTLALGSLRQLFAEIGARLRLRRH
jgi:hypothetical protein